MLVEPLEQAFPCGRSVLLGEVGDDILGIADFGVPIADKLLRDLPEEVKLGLLRGQHGQLSARGRGQVVE